jgi:extradiol dioxygenase family protein/transcriptional regulator with XRE-family HTH domain
MSTQAVLAPFHLAIPVGDLDAARAFYGDVMGFGRGRSDERWTDWNVDGHQVVTHMVDDYTAPVAGHNFVDGHQVPVPQFGLVLSVERFQELASRMTERGYRLRHQALRPLPRRAGGAVDDVLPRPVRQRDGVQGVRRPRPAFCRMTIPASPGRLQDDFLTLVGSRIRDRRKLAGLTVQELADRAGISRRLLTQIEHGQANPSLVTVTGIARALGVDFTDLLDDGPAESPVTVVGAAHHRLVWHSPGGERGIPPRRHEWTADRGPVALEARSG